MTNGTPRKADKGLPHTIMRERPQFYAGAQRLPGNHNGGGEIKV